MVRPLEAKAYFTYPIISVLASIVVYILVGIVSSVTAPGVYVLSTHSISLVLIIVFSAFLITGQLDASLLDSKAGLSIAKFLSLANKYKLDSTSQEFDLAYKTNVEGSIAQGAQTIEMTLTIIWLVIFVLGA